MDGVGFQDESPGNEVVCRLAAASPRCDDESKSQESQ